MSIIEKEPSIIAGLISQFQAVRRFSESIIQPLSAEDCAIQSMSDVSPMRWHLAHTTWFFETFALREQSDYQPFDERYHYLFNSYYNTLGHQFPRANRGLISRPGLSEILQYRRSVDQHILERLQNAEYAAKMAPILAIGLQHEQQHQELMLTDIKHILSCNPLWPVYQRHAFDSHQTQTMEWLSLAEGLYEIGHRGAGFAFDNESPCHQVYIQACELASQLVTCGQYGQFIEDDGYARPELWLSEGWQRVQQEQWRAPLYWIEEDGQWSHFTLAGLQPLQSDWPVCHLSYFEADAYARWAKARLPTEFEWEAAADTLAHSCSAGDEPLADYLFDHQLAIHPTRGSKSWLGGVWQWTSSSYAPYPGYCSPPGALGEYNGKFMCNQYVLRGGSVATSRSHIRPTYRNFFPTHARWQFTGLRLARSC